MADKLTYQQKLSAARILIRDRLPYFRSALFGAVYKEVEGLGTYAMSHTGVLMYDRVVVERESVENCAASILHEIMHWLRNHAKRCRDLAANPRIWNFAADAEINDDIVAMGVGKLPDQCVFAKHFEGPDGKPMADGNIAEVYYQALRQKAQQLKQPGGGQGQDGQEDGDGEEQDGSGDGSGGDKPSVGQGWCGSGAGRSHPKEPKEGNGKGSKDEKDGGQGDGDGGRSEAEAGRIRKAVAEAAVKHAQSKGRGTVPAGFLAWAEQEIAPPKIDWRTKLSKVVRAACAYRPGCVTTSWQGFGRKQAALGFGPGRPMTPKWRSPVPRVTVIVDTSGSMGGGPLARAASEVSGILKGVNSAVTIVACDAAVHSVKECSTWQEAVKEFKGGGGTDMRPAIEAVMHMRNRLPPEVLICITDGYIGDPGPQPPGVKMIWVIVGGMKEPCAKWGEHIFVDDELAQRAA